MTDLLDRLRTADPAADLPALPPASRQALLARAREDTRGLPLRPPVRRNARAALLPVAAAAVVVGVLASQSAVRPAGGDGPTLTLVMRNGDPAAICMPVADLAPRALAASEIAFAGRVTSVGDRTVVVEPSRFYRGGPAGEVRLTNPGSAALDGTAFTVGESVLVTAAGGEVAGCGLSGEASPALQALYDAAFPS